MKTKYVLGLNVGRSKYGKTLHDGAACLASADGVIAAIAEERITRRKRAGGYSSAARALLDVQRVSEKDLHSIVMSSCCDEQWRDPRLPDYPDTPTISCDHHVSHAFSTFWISPFREAIIAVLDAGGNTLDSLPCESWWKTSRQQHTYFLGDDSGVKEIGSDFSEPYAAGFGEIYRAFTYYLGWPSAGFASKTMALAAYGDASHYGNHRIFSADERGRLSSCVRSRPFDPIGMVESVFAAFGLPSPGPRKTDEPFRDAHRHLAAWIQQELELTLVDIVNRLISKTDLRDVCLAGGVAYNCKAIQTVRAKSNAERVHLGPASGDHGQALGNALFGLWKMGGKRPRHPRLLPYQGPSYRGIDEEVREAISRCDGRHILRKPSSLNGFVAKLLAMGHLVGWYQGRSEFGPRALGNRSILASPSLRSLGTKLNMIKGREPFMPFAPSVLADQVSEYFVTTDDVYYYMSVLAFVREERRPEIEAVVGVDGSSRLHTVASESNAKYYSLIAEFCGLTGIPMLLNTSFNGRGEPIVETVEDAVRCYCRLDLDAMVVEESVILNADSIRAKEDEVVECQVGKHNCEMVQLGEIIVHVRKHIEGERRRFVPRDRFLMYREYHKWLMNGSKTTTIRYRKHAVEYPTDIELPILLTDSVREKRDGLLVGTVRITRYEVREYGTLDDSDAVRDGFSNVGELSAALEKIYGTIPGKALIMIYGIRVAR